MTPIDFSKMLTSVAADIKTPVAFCEEALGWSLGLAEALYELHLVSPLYIT